jgi:hypothetical protein
MRGDFDEDEDDYPALVCPICFTDGGDDLDGFGFIQCQTCGFCTHPTRLGTVCEICGHDEATDAARE